MHQWKQTSIKGLGWHQHLYTTALGADLSDELETYLEREIETPAADALRRAVSLSRLSKADWHVLARFVAAQDVRTPHSLLQMLQRQSESIGEDARRALEKAACRLEGPGIHQPPSILPAPVPHSDLLPMQVLRGVNPETGKGELGLRIGVGRGLWHFSIYHLLKNTSKVLLKHRWTLHRAPVGVSWFTSDRPVIKLNANGIHDYNFGGGWGKDGSEIILPLSPTVLLYTQVGNRRPGLRGSELPLDQALAIRRMTARHAHRFIYSSSRIPDIEILRPRVVDKELYDTEIEDWGSWHRNQTELEREMARR